MVKFFGSLRRREGGFTLIELLVVIAIIGILASIVLASLNSARRKSRDARRVADIKQLQLALELYFDAKGNVYPTTAEGTAVLDDSGSCGTGNTCIPAIPADPLGGAYPYFGCTSNTAYHLGAGLEEQSNPALQSDLNAIPGNCAGSTLTASGNETGNSTALCVAGIGTGRSCYDVTP